MRTPLFLLLFFFAHVLWSQSALPEELGEHNLLQFNSSLFFPTASYGWQTTPGISVWGRWQLQMIDKDPSSFFANYAASIGSQTRLGLGYFENTGTFSFKKGGVFNFSQAVDLSENSKLVFGANLFGIQQEVLGTNIIPGSTGNTDFIGRLSLGAQLIIRNFSLLATLDNALDYNFSTSNRVANDRLFRGALSYDFPLKLFTDDKGVGVFRLIAYYKAMPEGFDAQYGLNALFSTSKFWIQGGYNSFYGPTGGLGVTLFKRFSLGGLVELPIDSQFKNEDPTFELLLSYRFGKFPGLENEDEEMEEEEEEKVGMAGEAELFRKEADSLNQILVAQRQQYSTDSIAGVAKHETELLLQMQILDSIAKAKENILRKENDMYTSAVSGLEKGYYLIINVYATQKYFNRFMTVLRQKGLEPNYFYRKANGYNYVYLRRYDTMIEAINSRDNNYNGKYRDLIWIFEAL